MAGIPPSIHEFGQRYAGRYFGKYRGIVSRVDSDPNKLFRIMARVPVVLGSEQEIGWAWPADGCGGIRSGSIWAPEVGDIIWMEFEEGDPSRPVWSHGAWGIRNNTSMVPKHALGEEDTIDTQVRDDGIIKPSQFAGEYPHVRIQQSVSGHMFEMDDTAGEERVQVAHRTGTRVEMLKDGAMEVVSTDETRHRSKNSYFLETEEWKIELDDSPTNPVMRIRHKTSGDGVDYGGATRSLTIVGTSSVTIRSVGSINIEGLTCSILGRPVVPGGGPI